MGLEAAQVAFQFRHHHADDFDGVHAAEGTHDADCSRVRLTVERRIIHLEAWTTCHFATTFVRTSGGDAENLD
jgi:hypothetical protein